MKLFLENVRSFEGWHEIPIAPATVLLGENSAGKSTLLGMFSVARSEGFPFGGNLFNQFPFELGSFKTIASNKKNIKYFSIGFETTELFDETAFNKKELASQTAGLIATFSDNSGLPVLSHMFVWVDDLAVTYTTEAFKTIDFSDKLNRKFKDAFPTILHKDQKQLGLERGFFFHAFVEMRESKKYQSSKRNRADSFNVLLHFVFGQSFEKFDLIAFAPMRSRPKRTYDQLSDEFSAEGNHVPLMLARATDPNNKQAAALHEAIQSFGAYSEMFTDIDVKQLGRGSGDPFQIQVKMGNKQSNIMDVGYGVSQVLPLIVDAQRAKSKTTLLLQQPEVHLHPKAQAALGSMIKDWVSKNNKTVVVETHSDYLVDRLRLEVKRGNLNERQLKIFFLEKIGSQTKLHVLSIDSEGNVLNAPEGYRDFFLREQMALLVG